MLLPLLSPGHPVSFQNLKTLPFFSLTLYKSTSSQIGIRDSCQVLHKVRPLEIIFSKAFEGRRLSPALWQTVPAHSLLQGIFQIQGSNPGLPHCRQILSHQGNHFACIARFTSPLCCSLNGKECQPASGLKSPSCISSTLSNKAAPVSPNSGCASCLWTTVWA